jgi:hypothetical protein
LLSHKRKAELVNPTPIKALRLGTAAADDAAWVAKCQAATEWLRLREAAAKAGSSAQEVTGSGVTVRGSRPAEAVLGDAGLKVPDAGGSESRSIATT